MRQEDPMPFAKNNFVIHLDLHLHSSSIYQIRNWFFSRRHSHEWLILLRTMLLEVQMPSHAKQEKFIESCSIYIAVFICHLSISNSILMPSMAKWRKDKIKSSFLLFCVMRFLASKNKTICYANKRILAKQWISY